MVGYKGYASQTPGLNTNNCKKFKSRLCNLVFDALEADDII